MPEVVLDDILIEIGTFGRFQLRQFLLMILPLVFNAFSNLSYVFTAADLNYRCYIPGCENRSDAVYQTDWLQAAVPFENTLPARCQRYEPVSYAMDHLHCQSQDFNQSAITQCSDFVYQDNRTVTIVNDFNLTCDENMWKITLVGTMHSIAQAFALLIGGIFSDRYGRKWALLLSIAFGSSLGIVRSFAVSYEMFLVFEFLEPLLGSTMYTTAFVLGQELVGPKQRVLAKSMCLVVFALGEALMGLIAMFVHNWRYYLLVLFVPGLISLSFLWITAESVRWLLSKGRRGQAVTILQQAAKVNGKFLSGNTLTLLADDHYQCELAPQSKQKASFIQQLMEVVKSKRLTIRLIICSFCWFTNVMVYYGLTLNSVTLSGDKNLNFILITLVEIPAALSMNFIMNRFSRRMTQFLSLALCGVLCLITQVIPADVSWMNTVMFLMSKMAISFSFGVLYIYTAEIFPTNLRQSLLSMCSMIGRLGAIVAPQMPLLAKIWKPLPMVLFGSIALFSALTILQFPETGNIPLPNTASEAENLKPDSSESERSENN